MAFVKRLVGPDENLIGIARLHWIYAVKALVWLSTMIILGGLTKNLIFTYIPVLNSVGSAVFWIALAFGALMFILNIGKWLFTELALTSERLIYKRGVIFVDTREVDLEEIKSESVDHGYLGRIFNYGYFSVDARFIEDMTLPAISKPYVFIKAMNAVRTTIKEDSMRVILDNGSAENAADALQERAGRRNLKGDSDRDHQINSTANETPMKNDQERAIKNDPKQNIKDIARDGTSLSQDTDIDKSKVKKEKQTQPDFQHDPQQHKKDLKAELLDDFEDAEELSENSANNQNSPPK